MLQFPVCHWAGKESAAAQGPDINGLFTAGDRSNLQPESDFAFVYRLANYDYRLTDKITGSFWAKIPTQPTNAFANALLWGGPEPGEMNIRQVLGQPLGTFQAELLIGLQDTETGTSIPDFDSGGDPRFVSKVDVTGENNFMVGFDKWHHVAFNITAHTVAESGFTPTLNLWHNGVQVTSFHWGGGSTGWFVIPDENEWISSDFNAPDLYDVWWKPAVAVGDYSLWDPAGSLPANGFLSAAGVPAVFLTGSNQQYPTNRGEMGVHVPSDLVPDPCAEPFYPPGAGPRALP